MDAIGYITLLATDSYLPGVLVLQLCLARAGAKHALYVGVSAGVSDIARDQLRAHGLAVIELASVVLPGKVEQELSHWLHSFDKLKIFSLTGFRKLVYLDSDLLVLRNIDELFSLPHMSTVCAGRKFPGNDSWSGVNSGLMVVEPRTGLSEAMERLIPAVLASGESVGDQDVIQAFYPWAQLAALELGQGYNVFSIYLDYYIKNRDDALRGEPVRVIHFIGRKKPWMRSGAEMIKHCLRLVWAGKKWEAYYNLKYAAACWVVNWRAGRVGPVGR